MSPLASKPSPHPEAKRVITSEFVKSIDEHTLSDGQNVLSHNDVPNTAREHRATYRAERRESYPFMELGFVRYGASPEYSTTGGDILAIMDNGVELPRLDADGNLVSDSQHQPTELTSLSVTPPAIDGLDLLGRGRPPHGAQDEEDSSLQLDQTRRRGVFLDTPFSRPSINVDFIPEEQKSLAHFFHFPEGESKEFAPDDQGDALGYQDGSPS
ncbi:hypothetical protein O1611_g2389 [Lasiodiplodia mahajangana]|uniref:Uncharacterized protein n=1 Tax=Lasiodiplodia mahajangana TaxID=1108764 RepID=A0ACC2JV64_9PEZI|nr:hypothetical protein O1611_g2389 [Lasiodiplodia mahajangana]